MQALSSPGLATVGGQQPASPTRSSYNKSALSADLQMKSDRNLSLLLSAVDDRGAPDRRSASIVGAGPLNGGRFRRIEVCAPRSAEAAGGANAGRNQGRKQAPSHGGLTRPVRQSLIDATESGTACRTGPPREGGAL